eukprot:5033275-Pleurochrysis_carterae.AAC.1
MWALAGVALRNRLLAAHGAPTLAVPQPSNPQQEQASNTSRAANASAHSCNNAARPVFRFNITWRPAIPPSTSSG